MAVQSALESERLDTNKQERLTREQMGALQGPGFVLLTFYDSEMGDMPTRVLTWTKAVNDREIRFFVNSKDRILRHLQFDQNVTLTIFALGTVTSLLCTARSLDDNLDGSGLALIRVALYEVQPALPSGCSLAASPTCTSAAQDAQKQQNEQYEKLVLAR